MFPSSLWNSIDFLVGSEKPKKQNAKRKRKNVFIDLHNRAFFQRPAVQSVRRPLIDHSTPNESVGFCFTNWHSRWFLSVDQFFFCASLRLLVAVAAIRLAIFNSMAVEIWFFSWFLLVNLLDFCQTTSNEVNANAILSKASVVVYLRCVRARARPSKRVCGVRSSAGSIVNVWQTEIARH